MFRFRPSGGWLTCALLVATLAMAARPAGAQLLYSEEFSYAPASLLTAAPGWAAHSAAGVNPIRISNFGLNYPGWPGTNTGLAAGPFQLSGEDDNHLFTAVTTGVVYAGVVVQVQNAQAAGDYFFHFAQTPASGGQFNGRLFARSSGTGFQIGLGFTNEPPQYAPAIFPFGQTVLAILRYQINPGANNDQVSLILNPTLPGAEPPPVLTANNPVSADPTGQGAICLRQGGATGSATVIVDGVRVGRTFADVAGSLSFFTIQANAGPNGAIAPSGSVIVTGGSNQNFTITPNVGFIINDVVVDGVSRGPIASYTFSSVSTNHTIGAAFLVDRSPPLDFQQLDFLDHNGNPTQLNSDIGEVHGAYSTDGTINWTNIIVRNPANMQVYWAARNQILPPNPPAPPIEELTSRFPLGSLGITNGQPLASLEYDVRVTPQPMLDAQVAQWVTAPIWRPAVSVSDASVMEGDAIGSSGPLNAPVGNLSWFPPFIGPDIFDLAGWIGCEMVNIDLDGSTNAMDPMGCVPAACANSLTWLDSVHPEFSIPLNVRQAFEQLSNLMNRLQGEGATEKDMIKAKLDFIEAYNLPIRVDYQSMRNNGSISSSSGNSSATSHNTGPGAWPTDDFLNSEVRDGEDVELFGGYYNWNGSAWVRHGGHCVVVTGAGTVCGQPFVFWKHDRDQGHAGGTVQEGGWIDVVNGQMHVPGLDGTVDGVACSFWIEGIVGESYDPSVTDPGGGGSGSFGGGFCTWIKRTIRQGSKLVVVYPDSTTRCFNSTVWVLDRTVRPAVWRKKHVWNFNSDSSRVIVNTNDWPITIAIHDDDHGPGGFTVGLDNPTIASAVDSPSNAGAFGGWSLGGADGLSEEFGNPLGTSASIDVSEGLNLSTVPAHVGGTGITSLTLMDPISSWNVYWTHLELHMTVLSVTTPGDLTITCNGGFQTTITVDHPGLYEIDMGYFTPAATSLTNLQTDANLEFELDAVGVASLVPVNLSAPAGPPLPVAFGLANLGPNPAQSIVRLRLDMPRAEQVDMAVFDIRGARVATVANGRYEAGTHILTWNRTDAAGRRVPPGLYYGRLTVAGRVYRTHMVVLQ